MLSILSSLLPFSASAKDTYPVISQRQVNIGGHVFSFDLPEGFSKDLPADDMVKDLEISSLDQFNDLIAGNILRRWWDIKEPGWFGSDLGTLMLEMSVQRIHPNTRKRLNSEPYDVTDRLGIMLAVDELVYRRYSEHNEEVRHPDGSWNHELAYFNSGIASMLGPTLYAAQRDHIVNGQSWLRYSISAPHDAIVTSYALPINQSFMIELTFTYAVNHGIALQGGKRDFLRTAEDRITNPIINSLYFEYPKDSPVKAVVEGKWLTETTDDVVRSRWQTIVKPLFGDEAYERALAEHQKLEHQP
ncbi:hypothetical protein KOI40_13870 [Aestuariicella sp. G3-2]|nr:hypothetical protein [Aestuariicella albida]